MHIRYDGHATNLDHQCAMLEGLAEGMVRSAVIEMDGDPDAFEGKCCVKCAELSLKPCNYMPGKLAHETRQYAEAIEEYAEAGDSIPQWARHKISRARTDVGDVKHYLEYQAYRKRARNAPMTQKQAQGLRLALQSGDASSPSVQRAIGGALRDHNEPLRNPSPGLELAATAAAARDRQENSEAAEPPARNLGPLFVRADSRERRNPAHSAGQFATGMRPSQLGIKVQGVRQLMRSQRGNALELAVFQCAQERRRGKDCEVIIDCDELGNCHAYLLYPNGDIKNPAESAVPGTSCGCGND